MFKGSKGMELAAALGQGYAIQSFFIPVLKKNKEINNHKYYLFMAFVIGCIVYSYIAFMGSYGKILLTIGILYR